MYSCFKPQIQVENLQHQACAQDRGWKDIYDIHIQDMVSHPRGTRSQEKKFNLFSLPEKYAELQVARKMKP